MKKSLIALLITTVLTGCNGNNSDTNPTSKLPVEKPEISNNTLENNQDHKLPSAPNNSGNGANLKPPIVSNDDVKLDPNFDLDSGKVMPNFGQDSVMDQSPPDLDANLFPNFGQGVIPDNSTPDLETDLFPNFGQDVIPDYNGRPDPNNPGIERPIPDELDSVLDYKTGTNVSMSFYYNVPDLKSETVSIKDIVNIYSPEFLDKGISLLYFDKNNGMVAVQNNTDKTINELILKETVSGLTHSYTFNNELPQYSRAWLDIPFKLYEVLTGSTSPIIGSSRSDISNNAITLSLSDLPTNQVSNLKVNISSDQENTYTVKLLDDGKLSLVFSSIPKSDTRVSIYNADKPNSKPFTFTVNKSDFKWYEGEGYSYKDQKHYIVKQELVDGTFTVSNANEFCKSVGNGSITSWGVARDMFVALNNNGNMYKNMPYYGYMNAQHSGKTQYIRFNLKGKPYGGNLPTTTTINDLKKIKHMEGTNVGFMCSLSVHDNQNNPDGGFKGSLIETPSSGKPDQVSPEWFSLNFGTNTQQALEACKSESITCSSWNNDSSYKVPDLGNMKNLIFIPQQQLIKYQGPLDIFQDGVKSATISYDENAFGEFGSVEWSKVTIGMDQPIIDMTVKIKKEALNSNQPIIIHYTLSVELNDGRTDIKSGIITLLDPSQNEIKSVADLMGKNLATHDKNTQSTFSVSLPMVDVKEGIIVKTEKVPYVHTVSHNGIYFTKNTDGTWTLKNETPSQLKNISVRGDDGKLFVIELNKPLDIDEKAQFNLLSYTGKTLTLDNQMSNLNNSYHLGTAQPLEEGHCRGEGGVNEDGTATNSSGLEPGETCNYYAPHKLLRYRASIAPSIRYYLHNTAEFRDQHNKWYYKWCEVDKKPYCINYKTKMKEGDWDYPLYLWARLTPQGRTTISQMGMISPLNGIGGGSGWNLIDKIDTVSNGWHSVHEHQFRAGNAAGFFETWTHELDHALGFSTHDEGPAGNFSHDFKATHIEWLKTITKPLLHPIPNILMDMEFNKEQRYVDIHLFQYGKGAPITNIDIEAFSYQGTLHKFEKINDNTIRLNLPQPFSSVLNVNISDRRWGTSGNSFITSHKFQEFDVDSKLYKNETTGQSYYLMSDAYMVHGRSGPSYGGLCSTFKVDGKPMRGIDFTDNNFNARLSPVIDALITHDAIKNLTRKKIASTHVYESGVCPIMSKKINDDGTLSNAGWIYCSSGLSEEYTVICETYDQEVNAYEFTDIDYSKQEIPFKENKSEFILD